MNDADAPGSGEEAGAGSLEYPTNRVLGAVAREALSQVVPALIDAGFAPIGILAGDAGLRRLQQTEGGNGIQGLLRRFQMSMGGDADYVTRATQELQNGHALVDVEVEGNDAKLRARDVFVQHGSHFVTYFTPWAIETLA